MGNGCVELSGTIFPPLSVDSATDTFQGVPSFHILFKRPPTGVRRVLNPHTTIRTRNR